jgi:hypothetical protein
MPKTKHNISESEVKLSAEFKQMIQVFHSTKPISNKEIIDLSKKKKSKDKK